MKPKEKLAKEYCDSKDYACFAPEISAEEGYLAGFDKALELAAELIQYREDYYLKARLTNLGEE